MHSLLTCLVSALLEAAFMLEPLGHQQTSVSGITAASALTDVSACAVRTHRNEQNLSSA